MGKDQERESIFAMKKKTFCLTLRWRTYETNVWQICSMEIFCRNGGKKFDVGEGEVTSVKGDKVQKRDELSLEIFLPIQCLFHL